EALLRIYDFKKDPTLLDEAVGHSARALQLNDHLAAAHITMGQVRRIQGQVEAAEQELQAALALEPTNAQAYRALGSLREFLKMNDAAEANYKKAVEIRPGDASGHIELGSFYFRQGKLADAERSQRNAIQLAPDSYLAHNNLGGIYYTQERYAEAAQEFEKSVSIAPNQRAYSNLGTTPYGLIIRMKRGSFRNCSNGGAARIWLIGYPPSIGEPEPRNIQIIVLEENSDQGKRGTFLGPPPHVKVDVGDTVTFNVTPAGSTFLVVFVG